MPGNFVMTTRVRADGSECCSISYKGQRVAALWVLADLDEGEVPAVDICSVDERNAAGAISWSKTLHSAVLQLAETKEDHHAARRCP